MNLQHVKHRLIDNLEGLLLLLRKHVSILEILDVKY